MIERKPRAPVLRCDRLLGEMPRNASSLKFEANVLHLEQPLVLLDQRVLGLGQDVDQRLPRRDRRASRRPAERPTNSGIRPNFSKSSGSRSLQNLAGLALVGAASLRRQIRSRCLGGAWAMIFSSPAKAPPQTNRMLVVSTCRNSCCGCLRPPCGGTEAMVPSMILSSACCTPSPDTSRVIEGLSDLRLKSCRPRRYRRCRAAPALRCNRRPATI